MIGIVELDVKPGTARAAADAIEKSLADTRKFDGCRGAEVLLERGADKVVIYERWESPDRQAAYLEWRAGPGASDAVTPFVAKPPEIRTYDEL
jgi:quinol monooxygenase YgiN